MNYFTDTARGNVMWVYCVKCTEVLDVIADEEVGAVLPVLPRDVPLAVHGGQPHPHPHTVRVPVPVVQHTLVIERAPGVQPPVPGGPGAHLSLSPLWWLYLSLTNPVSTQLTKYPDWRIYSIFASSRLTWGWAGNCHGLKTTESRSLKEAPSPDLSRGHGWIFMTIWI